MQIGSRAEQYEILIRTSKGKALETLISAVLSAPDIWTFGEYLAMENIKDVLFYY